MQPSFIIKINMDLFITSYSHFHSNKVILNDRILFYQENFLKFADFVKSVFRQEQITYPKFFKMDAISKLGFLASELVLKGNKAEGYRPESVGVVLANSSSSLDTDLAHQETIKDRSAYFPSPSVFVYTLPNIVIGEICIRHRFKGENAFLIAESFNATMLTGYINELFTNGRVDACLCGWVEVLGNNCQALMTLVEKEGHPSRQESTGLKPLVFNAENLNLIMKRN